MSRNWLAVASVPFREVRPGDRVVLYLPLRGFTGIGTVTGGTFPCVAWHDAREVPTAVLQDQLELGRGRNWSPDGLVEITAHDMAVIAEAMFTDEARPDRPGGETSPGSAARTSGSRGRSLPRAA